MNQSIPTEFQRPPDDEDDLKPYSPQGPRAETPKEGTLTIYSKEGHCRMDMARGPGPQNTEGNQSAGGEMDDALERARKLWNFSTCQPVSQEKKKEVWRVTFTD